MIDEPKTFHMIRKKDESGISGTGKILNGVVFPDGICVVRWCSTNKNANPSTVIYNSFKDFKFYHMDCHPTNETKIIWHHGNLK